MSINFILMFLRAIQAYPRDNQCGYGMISSTNAKLVCCKRHTALTLLGSYIFHILILREVNLPSKIILPDIFSQICRQKSFVGALIFCTQVRRVYCEMMRPRLGITTLVSSCSHIMLTSESWSDNEQDPFSTRIIFIKEWYKTEQEKKAGGWK